MVLTYLHFRILKLPLMNWVYPQNGDFRGKNMLIHRWLQGDPKVLPTDMATRLGRERKAPKGSMVHQLKFSFFESRWKFCWWVKTCQNLYGNTYYTPYYLVIIFWRTNIRASYFGIHHGARIHGESCSVMSWCHVATSCYRVATICTTCCLYYVPIRK